MIDLQCLLVKGHRRMSWKDSSVVSQTAREEASILNGTLYSLA